MSRRVLSVLFCSRFSSCLLSNSVSRKPASAELRLAVVTGKPDLPVMTGLRQLQAADDQALVASVSVPVFQSRRTEGYVAEADAAIRKSRVVNVEAFDP